MSTLQLINSVSKHGCTKSSIRVWPLPLRRSGRTTPTCASCSRTGLVLRERTGPQFESLWEWTVYGSGQSMRVPSL